MNFLIYSMNRTDMINIYMYVLYNFSLLPAIQIPSVSVLLPRSNPLRCMFSVYAKHCDMNLSFPIHFWLTFFTIFFNKSLMRNQTIRSTHFKSYMLRTRANTKHRHHLTQQVNLIDLQCGATSLA